MNTDDQLSLLMAERDEALAQRDEARKQAEHSVNRNHMLLRTTSQAQDELRQQLATTQTERDELASTVAVRNGQLKSSREALELARAELASARTELAALRTQLDQHRTTPEVTP